MPKGSKDFNKIWKGRFEQAKNALKKATGKQRIRNFENTSAYKSIKRKYTAAKYYNNNAKKINERRRELYEIKTFARKEKLSEVDEISVFKAFSSDGRFFWKALMDYSFDTFSGIINIIELDTFDDEQETIQYGTLEGFRMAVNKLIRKFYANDSSGVFKWTVARSYRYIKEKSFLIVEYTFTENE